MSLELLTDPGVLAAAALLVGGILLNRVAERVRLPALLLFLGLGMLIGDDGLNWISLADAQLAQNAGIVALVIILYAGGLATKPSDLKRAALPGMLLATAGVVVTAAVVAGSALLLLDVEPLTAALIGAVVASTDAAAIFAVLRTAPLPRRLIALLEVESGANDPVAIMLTIGLLETFRAQPTAADWVVFGLIQLGGGLVLGLLIGLVGAFVLTRWDMGSSSLSPVLAIGVAGLSYGIPTALGASGFLAVYTTGFVVGVRVPRHRRAIRTFHDGLANAAEIGLFLVLGLLVFPSQLPGVALPALTITAVLVLVARPLAIAACLTPLRYSLRDQTLVAWAGLRGAVPIVLATFALTAQHPAGSTIFNVTFFVVLVSTALQGTTVGWVASRLGLRERTPSWAPVAEALPLDGIDADLIEVDVTEELHVAGKRLADVPPPPDALLTTVVRGSRTILPTPELRLRPGDHALIAVPRRPEAVKQIVAWARGETIGTHTPEPSPPTTEPARREQPQEETREAFRPKPGPHTSPPAQVAPDDQSQPSDPDFDPTR